MTDVCYSVVGQLCEALVERRVHLLGCSLKEPSTTRHKQSVAEGDAQLVSQCRAHEKAFFRSHPVNTARWLVCSSST